MKATSTVIEASCIELFGERWGAIPEESQDIIREMTRVRFDAVLAFVPDCDDAVTRVLEAADELEHAIWEEKRYVSINVEAKLGALNAAVSALRAREGK